ncbi:TonB family protein [Mucilaginibacter sp. P25]|uniref:TonB family C-terminal domain-containing protein n=1 Tax=Mucilaginibacter gossypii TaxID=551996 RepID=A0A1G8M2J1_9SPHI|nr:energy transducer TonB [Mucilaginibacter gossypii]SDI62073.1 TonB family C-terminal domain-containing protein [Mucilaginibacter gossypii]
MKPLFTITLFLLITTGAYAQRQNVYFIKNNGKYVGIRDSADYIRVVREPDSASTLYNVFEFYANGTQKLIGKSSKINPPQFEGQCVTYYANGKKQSVISYKNGVKAGEDMEFYPNGRLYAQFSYPEDNKDRTADRSGNYLIIANKDSLGNDQVSEGNGYFKGYDNKFGYVEEEGPVKGGKRDGQWKGDFQDFKTTFTEIYDNGGLISGTATTKEGKVNTYLKSRGVPPQFKGGLERFGRFLSNNIKYPDDALRKGIEGTVVLSFVVEKDGTLTDIKVSKSVAPIIDDEAVRVLNNSPKWVPGTQFGVPVRVRYSVPVSFAIGR